MKVDAWQLLGIAPTSDVRALKRAYAARLKRCRPEDDAEGFALLRGAYEFLLAQVASRATAGASQPMLTPVIAEAQPAMPDVPVAPPAPVDPPFSPAVPPPLPVRSPQQIAADVVTQACQAQGYDATAVFARWLAGHPELMLLDRKPVISRFVLAQILGGQAPTPEVFGKLEAFFHWDDRIEQRRLAQLGLPIESALGQVEAAELRRVLAQGVARKRPIERGLDAARRAGSGRRAWWLALVRRQPHTVPQLLHGAIQRHGYRAVEQVFGADTLAFWQRAIAARPTRMQWIIGLARPLLIGASIALLGVPLGAVFASVMVNPTAHAARDTFTLTKGVLGWAGLSISVIGGVFKALQLTMRWLKQGPLQRTHAQWQELRLRLALDSQWRRALPAVAVLLAMAWYWPPGFTTIPYLVLVGALVWLHLRDLRSILGPCFAALAALPLSYLHAPPPLLAAAAMPLTLWSGNAIHDVMKRRGAGRPSNGTVVMLTGIALAMLLSRLPDWLQ